MDKVNYDLIQTVVHLLVNGVDLEWDHTGAEGWEQDLLSIYDTVVRRKCSAFDFRQERICSFC